MQEVQSTLKAGTIIQGRYSIESEIGMGSLYAAYLVREKHNSQKFFVLKEMPNIGWKERFRSRFNLNTLTDLEHPALPHVYKVFHIDKFDRTFMLAEYIEGSNLETLRQEQPNHRFSPLQVITSIVPIMEAVAYLHNQDSPIVHGNIKPSNIIMRKKDGIATLVGFNLTENRDKNQTVTFEHYHTPGFKAPEQYNGIPDPRTDIYALGAVLYTLLTGNIPAGVLYRVRNLVEKQVDPLAPISKTAPYVPSAMVSVIHRAMSIDKANRYATIEEFWNELWQASIITPTLQPPKQVEQQQPKPKLSRGTTITPY